MLSHYGRPGEISLDPFVGSGTAVGESLRLGMGSIATELNPAVYHMSKIRNISKLSKDERNKLID